jgi:hypothetical protein
MQRLDLGVLGFCEIVDIVALNRLIEKRKPQGEYEQRDDQQVPWRGHACVF